MHDEEFSASIVGLVYPIFFTYSAWPVPAVIRWEGERGCDRGVIDQLFSRWEGRVAGNIARWAAVRLGLELGLRSG